MQFLGEGTYGEVFKRSGNAIKIFKLDEDDEKNLDFPLEEMIYETKICFLLDHINIVKFISCDTVEKSITYELCECTINRYSKRKFIHFIDVIFGLEYLHSNNIVHLDIKANNVLVKNGFSKICDFGFSKKIHGEMFIFIL